METYFLTGLFLGVAAGFSPGPLMMLVIQHALLYGRKEGSLVALSPLPSDIPIIIISIWVLNQLHDLTIVMGIITVIGSGYLIFLGINSFKIQTPKMDGIIIKPNSLLKGSLSNVLNPIPYVFWMTIGSPLIIKAGWEHISWSMAFLFTFYLGLVGIRVILSIATHSGKQFIQGPWFLWINRILGIFLIGFAMKLIYDFTKTI